MPGPPPRLPRSTTPRRSLGRIWRPGFLLSLVLAGSNAGAHQILRHEPLHLGAPGMLQPHTGSLLVDYYEVFLKDRDVDAFRRTVSARYTEATLARVIHVGELRARRAAVLALGLFGGIGSNATVAHALRDEDPTVRNLAENALWAIWFRADTPENNQALERVQDLIGRGRFAEAVDAATALIARSPDFAEAYNQRAIAHFRMGRFTESIADCQAVVARNPYHTGALSGMGQCQLQVGRMSEALDTFRKALKLQPYNESLRQVVAEMEAEGP